MYPYENTKVRKPRMSLTLVRSGDNDKRDNTLANDCVNRCQLEVGTKIPKSWVRQLLWCPGCDLLQGVMPRNITQTQAWLWLHSCMRRPFGACCNVYSERCPQEQTAVCVPMANHKFISSGDSTILHQSAGILHRPLSRRSRLLSRYRKLKIESLLDNTLQSRGANRLDGDLFLAKTSSLGILNPELLISNSISNWIVFG